MRENYILDHKKLKKLLISIIIFILVFIAALKSAYYFAPFILAFVLASLMEPFIKLLVNKLHLRRNLASLFSLILLLVVLGTITSNLIGKAIFESRWIIDNYPSIVNDFYSNLLYLSHRSNAFFISLPEEVVLLLGNIFENGLASLTDIFKSIFKGVLNTAFSLPSALIFLLITIISTFFISSGRNNISNSLKKKLPEEWYEKIITIKNEVFLSLFKLIKAYLIIMSITFTELLIGFSALRLKYAIILAFLVCIIDILPVLGTGTILIPWSLYSLLTGNTATAISLAILYAVILIIRQLLEPKIIGQQIGVPPLITLMSIYAGLKLLGPAGLMLGPILMLITKNIFSVLYKGKTLTDLLFSASVTETSDNNSLVSDDNAKKV